MAFFRLFWRESRWNCLILQSEKQEFMDKLIFISNDDGYAAAGIQQLAEMMREMGDVFVVAPDGGRRVRA